MPGELQALPVPPPVSDLSLWNAIRVAFVNSFYPGAITYDPLVQPPPNVSYQTMIYATLLAAQGQLQS